MIKVRILADIIYINVDSECLRRYKTFIKESINKPAMKFNSEKAKRFELIKLHRI